MSSLSTRSRAVRRAVTRLGLAALLTTAGSSAATPPDPQARFETLWPPAESVRFQATTLEERAVFEELVPRLLRAAPATAQPPEEAASLAATVGFSLEVWRVAEETFWTLREKPERRRGAGAYVFRTGAASDDVVQVPHAYFDLGTGPIGVSLFLAQAGGARPRAFFTNTAHRYRSRPDERREDDAHPADVAHSADHLFTLMTDLAARELPRLRVLQLHGFGKSELPSRKGVELVLSAGSRHAPAWIRAVASSLTPEFGEGLRLYPEQTGILGGTQNAQAKLLQAYPHARFLHLELSAPARRSLAERERIERLGRALFTPGGE